MKPELKTPADRDALWAAIDSGLVDVVVLHLRAAQTLEEKQGPKPVYGVPGLETTLPLLGLAVHEGRLTPERLIALVADAPRRLFGLAAPAETYTVFVPGRRAYHRQRRQPAYEVRLLLDALRRDGGLGPRARGGDPGPARLRRRARPGRAWIGPQRGGKAIKTLGHG